MLLAKSCSSIFILLLAAALKLILNVEGEDMGMNVKQQSIHGFTENLKLHRTKREFGSDSNQCEDIEDELIYCPFKYTFQVSAKFQTTQAEVALCKNGFSTCPTKLNTSAVLNGCVYDFGCEDFNKHPSQCKVLGANCLGKKGKNGETNYHDCCNGRISTSGKNVIEVIGQCNKTSKICEPQFPLNTVCGDGSKEYLSCFYNEDISGRCAYPTESSKYEGGIPPSRIIRLKRSIKKSKVDGTEELGKCVEKVDTCDENKAVNIFCGPKLPVKYENSSFCGCPSPDLKMAFECDANNQCSRCNLLGGPCDLSNANCCNKYTCVKGLCVPKTNG